MNYAAFLESKHIVCRSVGIKAAPGDVHEMLFPFQRDLTAWAARKGRAAIFADTGLGKTLMQLEWARLTGERTLIIAPLSVAQQTVREAVKIGLDVHYVRSGEAADAAVGARMFITNYEMIGKFSPGKFGAVVLDESSILKALAGKTRRKLTDMFADTPYKLCCTATPAPNDYIELGNHAEFLGISTRSEMLAQFFINANKEHTFYNNGIAYRRKGSNKGGQEWRLKHHAEQPFFRWLSSWAIMMIKPSDLGYDDGGFILPPLNIHTCFVETDYCPDDRLFLTHIRGIREQAEIRRYTLLTRLAACVKIIAGAWNLTRSKSCHIKMQKKGINTAPSNRVLQSSTSPALLDKWIIWCGLNVEQEKAAEAFGDLCVSISGNMSIDEKIRLEKLWREGPIPVMITKPKIFGYGVNWQCAHKMIFFGLSHSWESWYQCIRRAWRYLQAEPVDVHIVLSSVEDAIYHNVMRKDAQARRLREEMIKQLKDFEKGELEMIASPEEKYEEDTIVTENWTAMLGDSGKRLSEISDCSIDLSIYSPPFADLYTYTSSPRDLGNSRNWDEFFDHYAFIIREVLRVTKSGRVTCVHTSDIPALAQKDGYIGIKDFPGRVIAAHEKEGWIFHGRIVISKNPQAQAIRTHSKGLLFVQLKKDSVHSRPALLDQVLVFRKAGENEVPITPVDNGEMDNELWIKWACGIWHDINETDVLRHGYGHGRAHDDEKHICPLQLETIERCIKLYSNPGETVFSPFAGIGSEIYQAVKFGRRGIGIELKPGYFRVAVRNLRDAVRIKNQPDLFGVAGIEVV